MNMKTENELLNWTEIGEKVGGLMTECTTFHEGITDQKEAVKYLSELSKELLKMQNSVARYRIRIFYLRGQFEKDLIREIREV